MPGDLETAVLVKGTETLIGDQRIVAKLKGDLIYPKVH